VYIKNAVKRGAGRDTTTLLLTGGSQQVLRDGFLSEIVLVLFGVPHIVLSTVVNTRRPLC